MIIKKPEDKSLNHVIQNIFHNTEEEREGDKTQRREIKIGWRNENLKEIKWQPKVKAKAEKEFNQMRDAPENEGLRSNKILVTVIFSS